MKCGTISLNESNLVICQEIIFNKNKRNIKKNTTLIDLCISIEKIGLEIEDILIYLSNFMAGVDLVFSQQSKTRRTNLRKVHIVFYLNDRNLWQPF